MPESLAERLRKVIEHLRFLGKNQEADIIAMLIRNIIELTEFSDIEEVENILKVKLQTIGVANINDLYEDCSADKGGQ